MQGERVRPLSFENPESYRYRGREKDAYLALNTPKPAATQPVPQAAAKRT